MPSLKPGLVFSMECDGGVAVGLMTHYIERTGHLIWVAAQIFADDPSLSEVARIDRWRWPILFPLAAALRRGIVKEIGSLPVPKGMQELPLLRGGNRKMGWRLVKLLAGGGSQIVGVATDPTVPIYKVVNDTRLREMLSIGWHPEDEW